MYNFFGSSSKARERIRIALGEEMGKRTRKNSVEGTS